MKEFDKVVDGILILEKIGFNRVLYRKVRKANDRGSKVSIPKELNLEGEYVYVIVPKGKK